MNLRPFRAAPSLWLVALITAAAIAIAAAACTRAEEPTDTPEPPATSVQQAQPTATASQPTVTPPTATTTPPTATPDTRSLQNIPTVSGTLEATATSAPVLGNSPVAVPTPTLRPNESWRSEVSYVRINSTVRASLYDAFSGVISTRLNYEVISTDENIARATVEGHSLRYLHVTGVGRGKATMTVTATAPGEVSTSRSFTIIVLPMLPPTPLVPTPMPAVNTPTPVPPTNTPAPPSPQSGNRVGQSAPDFEVTTIDGVTRSLTDFKQASQPVVLYFFASW